MRKLYSIMGGIESSAAAGLGRARDHQALLLGRLDTTVHFVLAECLTHLVHKLGELVLPQPRQRMAGGNRASGKSFDKSFRNSQI